MNSKRIFAFVSAFTIALAGVPAHAVFAEEAPSVDEAVVVEETVEEAAKEVVTDEVVTPVVEKTVETEEETAADGDVLVEDETKATKDVVAENEKAESDKLTDDKKADAKDELKKDLKDELEKELEEEHEHEFNYISIGNHQHKVVCVAGGDDCDFEEVVEGCVDEDGDEFCDFCHQDLKEKSHQLASGITIEVKSWTPFYNEDGEKYVDFEGNEVGVYAAYIPASCGSSERLTADGIFELIKNNDSISYGMNDMSFFDLDGFDAVYNDLLAIGEEIPSNTYVTITERDGVIEDFSIEYEDNYVPEEERVYVEKEDPEAKDADAKDAEDKEAKELPDDTEIVAKEDEILPEDVVVDEAETVEPTEQTEELVEGIVVDETLAEDTTADETPAANDSAAEETVTDSVVDGE